MFFPGLIGRNPQTSERPPTRTRQVVVECLVVAALVVSAFWYGRFAFLNTVAPPDYYWMSPAVMVATGRGFVEPVAAKGSPLDDFLASRRPALDVRDATPTDVAPQSGAEYAAVRYLIFALGYWWRVTGIRWSALGDIAAALHVLAVLGTYATLRLFMGTLLSIGGALWMCVATAQLSFVPHMRDYSKGGFILAVIPLILFVTLRARSRTAVIAGSAAAGGLIGVGLGFRMDLAIMVPLAIACVVLFRTSRPWTGLTDKAVALGALLSALLVASYPVVSRMARGGSNSMHVILLGYADQFDGGLGIAPAPYRLLPEYDDGYVASVVAAKSESALGRWPGSLVSVDYDRVGSQLWTELLRRFPADALVRVFGAANTVLNLVFVNLEPDLVFKRAMPGGGFLKTAYRWLEGWNGWGVALGALFLVVASAAEPRLGLLTAFLVVALGGYPSLQFGPRHYFHLQIVPVFALIVVARAAALAPFRIERSQLRPLLTNVATAVVPVLVAGVLPLLILRAYQSHQVDRMLSRFLASPRTQLPLEYERRPDNKWLVRWPMVGGKPSALGPLAWAYYMVEFDAKDSPAPPAIGLRYRQNAARTTCLRVLSVPPESGVARFGFEVFSSPGREFEGIEVEERARGRLLAVYRTNEDGPAGLPMELRLPSDWQRQPLYQRLRIEDRRESDAESRAAAAFRTCD